MSMLISIFICKYIISNEYQGLTQYGASLSVDVMLYVYNSLTFESPPLGPISFAMPYWYARVQRR